MTNNTEYFDAHIGELIQEEFLIPSGLSQNALAKAIHVPPGRINEIINGTRKVTADTDLRLCNLFGFADGFFLRIQEQYDLAEAKRKILDDLNSIEKFSFPKQKNNSANIKQPVV